MKMNLKMKVSPDTPRREIRVKPTTYQPSKYEMEELIRLPAGTTPQILCKAVMTPVRIIEDPNA